VVPIKGLCRRYSTRPAAAWNSHRGGSASGMNAATSQSPPVRFHSDRPTDLRTPSRWHRLSYIIEALPRGLRELSDDLRTTEGSRILDFGCADQPYRRFFHEHADYVGADLPGNPLATVSIAPDGTLPLPDESFDAVLSTQVLEHVADPAVYLRESFRLLRPGGRMLLSTHGLMVYHPDPVDYWRWTGAGLQLEVERAGFKVERFEGIMGLAAAGLQLAQDGVYWQLPAPLRAPLALIVQSLIRFVERRQGPAGRRYNALVFALVAVRP
jgi:SAM-dependent methyltransferase